jgi:ankyrin repeat protein
LHKRRHDLKSDDGDKSNAQQGDATDGNGTIEPISKAAEGDWRAVKNLLAAGADPNQGFTALHLAAFLGQVVRILLADTEPLFRRESLVSGGSYLCLHLASQNGHLEVVKALVKEGGETLLNKTCANGASCLHVASQKFRMGTWRL